MKTLVRVSLTLLFAFLLMAPASAQREVKPIEGCTQAFGVDYITDVKTFNELADLLADPANKRVAVIIRAAWCPPCCATTDWFRELAEEFSTKGAVFVNAEYFTMGEDEIEMVLELTRQSGYPTITFFLNGKYYGAVPFSRFTKETHAAWLEKFATWTDDQLLNPQQSDQE